MGIPIGLTMVILMDFSQVVSPYMRQYDLRDSCATIGTVLSIPAYALF